MSGNVEEVVGHLARVVAELRDRANELERFAASIQAETSANEPGIGEWYYLAQNTTTALHEALRPPSIAHAVNYVNRCAFDVAAAHEAVEPK